MFEQLFGRGGTPQQRRETLRRRGSLLDSVASEIKRLQKTLGPGDRNKIDDYMTSIREVERRIDHASQNSRDNPLPDLDRPTGVPDAYADHARLMFDLQWLAFRGDITRVATFQLAREGEHANLPGNRRPRTSSSRHPPWRQ